MTAGRSIWLLPLVLPACLPDFPTRDFVEDPTTDSDGDGFSELDGDCDDASAAVYPGAPEVCDDRDNDCDGRSDELTDPDDGNYVAEPPVWYWDGDRDGFGDDNYPTAACAQPDGGSSSHEAGIRRAQSCQTSVLSPI